MHLWETKQNEKEGVGSRKPYSSEFPPWQLSLVLGNDTRSFLLCWCEDAALLTEHFGTDR